MVVAESKTILEMRHVDKAFPGVQALSDVSYDLRPGEVHIILGENGAGKSTLMKILAGIYPMDSGEILLHGKAVTIRSVADARRHGIEMIHQELDLIPSLNVAENIYLGAERRFMRRGLIDNRAMLRAASSALQRLEVDVDPETTLKFCSVAARQMVAIARALEWQPSILIMDEPTAAIGQSETGILFDTMKRLVRERRISICYISHRLAEFSRVGDRVTVLRDGRNVATRDIKATSRDEMVRLMVGRKIDQFFPPRNGRVGSEALRCENLCLGRRLHDVSFSLAEGEIVGLFGLVGSGRTELAHTLFGASRPTGGSIFLRGKPTRIRSPGQAVRRGIGLLVEDRKQLGLLLNKAIGTNITLAAFGKVLDAGLLNRKRETAAAEKFIRELSIRTPGPQQAVQFLSGGNQQKVIFARWLFADASILILDEPTRGIDVAAKREIFSLMNALTDRGVAILLISSEIEEVLAMSDRILVMHEGRLAADFPSKAADEETVMHYATGRGAVA